MSPDQRQKSKILSGYFLTQNKTIKILKSLVAIGIYINPICAAAQTPTNVSNSKYYAYYQGYTPKASSPPPFWRNVSSITISNSVLSVNNGLAVWDNAGTYGQGIISESMGYAMILAALYNDQATFNGLSATVQAGLNTATGLFPWYWYCTAGSSCSGQTAYYAVDTNSAGDGDINIALAYVYADQATNSSVYSWTNPTAATYKQMAQAYIAAIRKNDFSTTDTNTANNYILADGAAQAASTFQSNTWHPDYSDIRAYQLFQLYDTGNTAFWENAISYTQAAWQSVFYFGAADTRTMSGATGTINASLYNTKLSNPTYSSLQASLYYYQTSFSRNANQYNSDSDRLPVRIENYLRASDNVSAQSLPILQAIAGGNLDALGASFTSAGNYISSVVNITSPWYNSGGYIQNFISAGLLLYALDPNLSTYYSNSNSVANYLNKAFGTNGTNGTINDDLNNNGAYNASLSLWNLTVPDQGETPLQTYMRQLNTNSATSSGTTLTYTYDDNGESANTTSLQSPLMSAQITALSSKTLPLAVKTVSLYITLEALPSHRGASPVAISVTRPGGVPFMVYSSQRVAPDSQGLVNLGVLQVPNNAGLPLGASPKGTWRVSLQSTSGKPIKIKTAILTFNK